MLGNLFLQLCRLSCFFPASWLADGWRGRFSKSFWMSWGHSTTLPQNKSDPRFCCCGSALIRFHFNFPENWILQGVPGKSNRTRTRQKIRDVLIQDDERTETRCLFNEIKKMLNDSRESRYVCIINGSVGTPSALVLERREAELIHKRVGLNGSS